MISMDLNFIENNKISNLIFSIINQNCQINSSQIKSKKDKSKLLFQWEKNSILVKIQNFKISIFPISDRLNLSSFY